MIIVRIPWHNTGLENAHLGIQISRWCKEQGLKYERDYIWRMEPQSSEIRITLNDGHESLASILALRWAKW